MELQLTELLNLTDVEVEYYQNLGQELILYVELKGNYATCPRCGQVSHHLHQNHGYLVRDLPLSNRQVEALINQGAKKILPLNLSSLKRLGIDEISLVKGQGKFIVVLGDLDTGKLVGLVKEKKKKSIEEVLLSWGTEILQQIEELSMDRAKIYKSVAEKLCPNAVITVRKVNQIKRGIAPNSDHARS